MAIKKPPKRAAATRNPPLAHRRNKLIQCSVGLLANESEDALGMVLQDRTATPARLRYTHAMIAPTLQPFDRSAGTDFKAFGRLTSRRSRLHRFDNSLTQVTGQRFRHRRSPHRRINADRLAQSNRLGNPPDSNRAEHALVRERARLAVEIASVPSLFSATTGAVRTSAARMMCSSINCRMRASRAAFDVPPSTTATMCLSSRRTDEVRL